MSAIEGLPASVFRGRYGNDWWRAIRLLRMGESAKGAPGEALPLMPLTDV